MCANQLQWFIYLQAVYELSFRYATLCYIIRDELACTLYYGVVIHYINQQSTVESYTNQ